MYTCMHKAYPVFIVKKVVVVKENGSFTQQEI